jgi:3-deoxy-manno-octulosonate cytidylyltransferase (CMP-KDO synthetase)
MQNSPVAIVIPARIASSRLPNKPLYMLAGKPMLQWVIEAARQVPNASVMVATDDQQIAKLAANLNVDCALTPAECPSGTDRIYAALAKLANKPKYIINLQGDAPLTNPQLLQKLITKLTNPQIAESVVTPVIRLTWEQYDHLVANKIKNPNSGTLCIKDHNDYAIWFSKQIIPAIRNIAQLREKSQYSPYLQHLGLYGYTFEALQQFVNLPVATYEQLECLEQLRFLENNIPIKLLVLDHEDNLWSGVDTSDDAQVVAAILQAKIQHD